MLKLSQHSKTAELKLKLPERPPELPLLLMPKSTSTSIKLLIPLSSKLKETPKPLDPSTSKVNQKLLLSSELEVSESLLQSQRRSSNSSDWDNYTMLFSLSLTKPHGIWSKWLNHSLPMDTHLDKLLASSSTREDAVKSKEEDFLSLITPLLKESSANTVLLVLRISSMKLSPVVQNSRKPTTSCGHSNFLPHSVDLKSRDTHSPKASVLSETEKSSSTPLWRKCCERTTELIYEFKADLQTTNEEMLIDTYLDSEINEREHWLHKYPLKLLSFKLAN